MDENDEPKPMGQVIQIDEARIAITWARWSAAPSKRR